MHIALPVVNAKGIASRCSYPAMGPDPHMADRLIQAREAHGRYKTPTEAARAMGISEPTYLGHENGSRGFKSSAARYARFYGVQLVWLLTGTGSMKGHPAQTLFDQLDAGKQTEALNYLKYLTER